MRRLLKFLHSVGAAGLMGGAAALALALMAGGGLAAIGKIAVWIVAPSLLVTMVSGLLAMVVHPPFQDAGWVWAKAASGILVFQAGLHILGPIQAVSKTGASAQLLHAEANMLWLLFVVCLANIALGIWRPRFPNYPV